MASGKILTLLIIATFLAVISAQVVAWRYRVSMKRLMRATLTAATDDAPTTAANAPAQLQPPAQLTLADNQHAYRRLLLQFMLLTVVMALTRTVITQWIADAPITFKTVATLGAAYAWPVLPVLAVMGRWSRWRFVAAMLGWFVLAVLLLSWRTNETITLMMIVKWMSFDVGLPLLVVTALCLGGATRAVGPWLAPLFVLLSASSQLGVDLLASLIESNSPVVQWLASWLGATWAIVAFALLPWLVAWWPARWLGRQLARAYRKQQVSELFYLYTAVWTIALISPGLMAMGSMGWAALVCFVPLLWIPLGAALMQRLGTPTASARPPTLLVLRVFQQDANVQDLFDRVIERWRVTGNTVLIAGTDLLERTIDAEDIFTFIDGRLQERFIQTPADVPRRLADFEWRADVDGRHRVNEIYCHDTTWQQALDELVRTSDVVLMDLRNFVAQNKGCLHELQVLTQTHGLRRVVVLVNDRTELPPAQAATAGAPAGRFVWLSQQGGKPLATDAVLEPLFTMT
ncbi:hypothetical protein HUU62_03475 [Rhodoferax sp. 4810]|nr:hypothetical protein [Rhodoferax jenense]